MQVRNHVPGGAVVARGNRLFRAVLTVRAPFNLVLLAYWRLHQLCLHIWLCVDVPAAVHQPQAKKRITPALEGTKY